MRKGTATKQATSHAGIFDGFEVFWVNSGDWYEPDRRGVKINCPEGWYVGVPDCEGNCFGPHETSQAAFGVAKDAIDGLVASNERIANHVDGYDRDDLGESPDY